jgi:P450-derived glycosyltransferase activator
MSTTTDTTRTATNSDLGRHLLTVRGFQFIFGAQGDPYALLLRAGSDDPEALGTQVRERGTLYKSEAGAWVTGHYALARDILADPRLELRHEGEDESLQQHMFQDIWNNPKICHIVPLDNAFLNLKRADYERLGKLFDPLLGADAVRARRPAVERIVERIAGGLPGEFDLMADFARPAATALVAEILAVPADKRNRFAELASGVGIALDSGLCPPQYKTARALMTSLAELRELFGTLELWGEQRPKAGAEDVLAAALLLTVVGIEVATNLICNAVAALLDHPEQWQVLRGDPGLAGGAVEEALRFDSPVRLENRITTEDVELGGEKLPADSQLVVVVGAANRDPAVFAEPDRFDITRKPEVDHLSLFGGFYGGFVAPLVRLQAEVAVGALAVRFPALRHREGVLRRMRSPVSRGVLRFPVSTA